MLWHKVNVSHENVYHFALKLNIIQHNINIIHHTWNLRYPYLTPGGFLNERNQVCCESNESCSMEVQNKLTGAALQSKRYIPEWEQQSVAWMTGCAWIRHLHRSQHPCVLGCYWKHIVTAHMFPIRAWINANMVTVFFFIRLDLIKDFPEGSYNRVVWVGGLVPL